MARDSTGFSASSDFFDPNRGGFDVAPGRKSESTFPRVGNACSKVRFDSRAVKSGLYAVKTDHYRVKTHFYTV
jgi:hypothetical protein